MFGYNYSLRIFTSIPNKHTGSVALKVMNSDYEVFHVKYTAIHEVMLSVGNNKNCNGKDKRLKEIREASGKPLFQTAENNSKQYPGQ